MRIQHTIFTPNLMHVDWHLVCSRLFPTIFLLLVLCVSTMDIFEVWLWRGCVLVPLMYHIHSINGHVKHVTLTICANRFGCSALAHRPLLLLYIRVILQAHSYFNNAPHGQTGWFTSSHCRSMQSTNVGLFVLCCNFWCKCTIISVYAIIHLHVGLMVIHFIPIYCWCGCYSLT